MEVYSVEYSDKVIEFEVQRKDVKNINLNVKPNMKITVSVNEMVPVNTIKDFVKEKAPWILKQVKHFKKVQPESLSKKEYISGETFKYLGIQYRLKVEERVGEETVKLYRGYFYLYINDKKNYKKKEKLMDEWFKVKANETFETSLNIIYPLVEKYDVKKPKLLIRSMKARWGSCQYDKNIIILNHDLIKAPKFCINYVLLHELVHFINKNHNEAFYNLLTVLMPDWKSRKEILDEEVVKEL